MGGVAQLGHPVSVRTIVDVDPRGYDWGLAAGGHPHYAFPTFDELVRVTAGEAPEVGRGALRVR